MAIRTGRPVIDGGGAPEEPVVEPVVEPVEPVKPRPKLISTYTDPETGDIVDIYDNLDGLPYTETIRKKGTVKADKKAAKKAKKETK